MTVIVVKMDDLPNIYRKEVGKVNSCMKKAARAAAHKLKAYLVEKTDDMGITYMGTYKGGFEVDGNSVTNTAPHAGIIELGARPHKVSMEGVEAIKQWVRVKLLGLPAENWNSKLAGAKGTDLGALNALLGVPSQSDEATRITWAIVRKIEREGQKPKYIMRDALPKAAEYYKEEFERLLAEESTK